MDDTNKPSDRGDITRRALIEAALVEFARSGYHGVGNREISLRAQVNQALIGYHFGNKEGLYLAVFHHICEQIRSRIKPRIDAIEACLAALPPESALTIAQQETCIALLLQLFEGMLGLFVSPQMETTAQLIMHEQRDPTKAFDILYEGFMKRSLAIVTGLVQRMRPDMASTEAALTVSAILGQALVFRAARSTMLRHLGWTDVGPEEFELLLRQTRKNVRALVYAKD